MTIIWCIYSSWDMEWDGQYFLSFWTVFCHPPSYQHSKSKFWKNENQTPGYIIILHMCTINNHKMYGSRDMEHDQDNFLYFGLFLPFYSLTTQKIKILKKWKKTPWDIRSISKICDFLKKMLKNENM